MFYDSGFAHVRRRIFGVYFVNTRSISLAVRSASVLATSFHVRQRMGRCKLWCCVWLNMLARSPFALRRLETPTVVWNSECRHMLGVVLRELEGATPGLQDVPAIEVHEVQ